MPALEFTDQTGRLTKIVSNAVDGATYRSAAKDAGMLTVVAVRDGKDVSLRFRGVKDSNTSEAPSEGLMKLRSVKGGSGGCLSLGLFGRNNPGIGYARVRIDVGDARLEIVCQDAEWWEDEASPEQ